MSSEPAELLHELHDRHASALWRYAARLTGDHHRAEDIVQEALLRACKRPQAVPDDETSSRQWLFTVVHNLVIDEWRRARTKHEVTSDDVPERATADGTDAVLDSWLVTDALANLSEDHRAVIVHAYYGRRTIADIAEALALSPGTVKSRLHYGVRALRLALQERGVTQG